MNMSNFLKKLFLQLQMSNTFIEYCEFKFIPTKYIECFKIKFLQIIMINILLIYQ